MSGLFLIVSLKTRLSFRFDSLDQLKNQPFFLVAFFKSALLAGCTSVGKLSPEIVLIILFVSLSISIPK